MTTPEDERARIKAAIEAPGHAVGARIPLGNSGITLEDSGLSNIMVDDKGRVWRFDRENAEIICVGRFVG